MKLQDLSPSFVGHGGDGITRNGESVPRREGIGVSFYCPCGCESRCFIPFENPLDGGEMVHPMGWRRDGDDLTSLTLHPSIQRVGGCEWHGWIRGGEVINA